ncbi:PRC-barrel domain containing protein [Halobaculum litoreum]|uniref:PRC-barrel domain containing protein n=1 Tax=Halobaculum litoreum TaxID=3031998 RepID=A0ABD5XMX0_9EURY|nr:PRC-barrel domain containing protein [Halobaculum sp. DT92]
MDRNHVTEEDEGKAVVDSGGRKIGMITEVKSGTAYVDADPGIGDSIRSKLGWGAADEDDYPLDESRIHTITDDEVRLTDSF